MKISEMTKEDLAERLVLSVKNSDKDKEFLAIHPYINKGSFSLVCNLYVDKKGTDEKELIAVSNELLNSLGISKSEMFELAVENSKKMFPVMAEPLESFSDLKDIFITDGINLPKCVLLSNHQFFDGAAAMFYQNDILSKISNKLNCNELYLIPFSKDVVFCVPSSNLLSLDEIKSVAADFMNDFQDGDRLINSVMVYDSSSDIIREDTGLSYSLSLNDDAQVQSVSPVSVSKSFHR